MDPITPSVPTLPAASLPGDPSQLSEHTLISMFSGSGVVVQLVLFILIGLSIWSWAITISKSLQLKRIKSLSEEFSSLFWEARNFARIDDSARRLIESPLARLFAVGYRELIHLLQEYGNNSQKGVTEDDLHTVASAMKRAEIDELGRLEKGITFLATTASAAPFIGLFGTVWGIMNAFHGLSNAKSTTVQAVAPGISEALVATAVGLAAAIPAAIAYNYFASSIKQSRAGMSSFVQEFVAIARKSYMTKR